MTSNMLLILLSVFTFFLVWWPSRRTWQASYLVFILVGLISSAITYVALFVMVILALLLIHYKKDQKFSLVAGAMALTLGLALGLHIVPGFNNYQYGSNIQLSASAVSFDIWFNWDKSMFGLLVLGIVLRDSLIRNTKDALLMIASFLPLAILGISVIYLIALAIGYSKVDWTPAFVFIPWVIKNLVFTVLAEEVFFRGIVQTQLAKLTPGRYAAHISVFLAGCLFGAAHFSGGLQYVFLSSLAGILYGYTYKITGRIEAPIITHLLLNSGHFLIFAYPYSAT